MSIQFDSLQAFFNMGGYGFYVWFAYGITFSALGTLIWHSLTQKQRTMRQISQKIMREQRLKQHREQQ